MTMPNWDDRKKAVLEWIQNNPVNRDHKSAAWRKYIKELVEFQRTTIRFKNIKKFEPVEPEILQWRWPGHIGSAVFTECGRKYAERLGKIVCKMLLEDGILEKGGRGNSQYRIKPDEGYF
jgi:hypothetical protein